MDYSALHTPEFWEGWFGTPSNVKNYFFDSYEYIDDRFFMPDALDVFGDWQHAEGLLEKVEDKFLELDWKGNGTTQLLWLPPFVVKRESLYFRSTSGGNALFGFYALHVKQYEDGISWLAAPRRLELNTSASVLNPQTRNR